MTNASGPEADARQGRTLFAGSARGRVVRLDEPLSLWGGMDPATGTVIDRRHPQSGQDLAGRVVLPMWRNLRHQGPTFVTDLAARVAIADL